MRTIGLTGGIGTGKSSVSALLRERGLTVIDADEAVRTVQARGSEGLKAIVDEFGLEVLTADGDLDRPRLAAIVFADSEGRRRLNEIVHPRVRAWMADRQREAAQRGEELVVLDIPLLYETRGEAGLDAVVLVYAPDEIALERLLAERGMSESDARARIAAQLPIEEKRRRTRFVIENTGSREQLRAELDRVWPEVVAQGS